MLKQYEQQTNMGILGGVLLKLPAMACVMLQVSPPVVLALVAASLVCFVWGCTGFAAGKGYPKWLGLLGLASFLGLMVLVLLKDHQPSGQLRGSEGKSANKSSED